MFEQHYPDHRPAWCGPKGDPREYIGQLKAEMKNSAPLAFCSAATELTIVFACLVWRVPGGLRADRVASRVHTRAIAAQKAHT